VSSRRRGGGGKVQPLYVFFLWRGRSPPPMISFRGRVRGKERALNKPPSACIRKTPSLSGTLLSLGNACVLEVPRALCPPLCNAALPLVPLSLRPRAVAVEDSRKTARDQITKPQPAGKPTSARGTMTTEHRRCVKARRCEVME
jgi:hypothetical protein